MAENVIGIKVGDGSFFPVLEESFHGKKRFVLTTVNDNQTSVQIDFYRSHSGSMEAADYIGSLVIENIESAPKQTPEIEVIVGIDSEHSLHAVAKNLSSSEERQSLTVSLESLGSGLTYDIPEFELDENMHPTSLFEGDQNLDDETVSIDEDVYIPEPRERRTIEPAPRRKGNPVAMVLFVLACLLILVAVTLGIFWLLDKSRSNGKPQLDVKDGVPVSTDVPLEDTGSKESVTIGGSTAESLKPAKTSEAIIVKTDPPVVTTAPIATKPPVKSAPPSTPKPQKKEEVYTGGGFWYYVMKGDTLWDLAQRFYGNPWFFYKIYSMNKNKIKDPDLILVGTKLYIPE